MPLGHGTWSLVAQLLPSHWDTLACKVWTICSALQVMSIQEAGAQTGKAEIPSTACDE